MITDELATFFESGVSILVGTRDARLVPDCLRALGARVEPGGQELTVFVPAAVGATSLANVRDNGRVAVCFTRPEDHRSIQVKGTASVSEATPEQRPVVEAYRGALAKHLAFVGLPPRMTFRMAHWPCHALRIQVESVFLQTPGPNAGAPLTAAG